MFDQIFIPGSIGFIIGTIIIIIFIKRYENKQCKSAIKKISASFVGWEEIIANPTRDIRFFYPIFKYEYQTKNIKIEA